MAACAAPFLAGEAYANQNLYVSAQNPRFDNHFAGSMVVEVVVNDPDLKETNTVVGEPDVTVNGRELRMVQGTDGSWYAYFASVDAAKAADQIVAGAGAEGKGLDFGVFCSASTDVSVLGADFSESEGVAIPQDGGLGGTNGQASFVACTGSIGSTGIINNVVRNPRSINTNSAVPAGQIGLNASAWPVIQLFPSSNAEIKYNKFSGTQQVNLRYDEIPNIAVDLDRQSYPSGAEVFVTISDIQLNQDPTDEDSWTFNVNSPLAAFYQAYDERGSNSGNGGPGLINLGPHLSSLHFDDNGQLEIDLGSVIDLKTNRFQPDGVVSGGAGMFTQIATLVESGPNSGVFNSYDRGSISTIGTLPGASRGLTGTIQYGDRAISVISGSYDASVDLNPDGKDGDGRDSDEQELKPGKRTKVSITDADQNINSDDRDNLDVYRDSAIIPFLRLGDPLGLGGASEVRLHELPGMPAEGGIMLDSFTDDAGRLLIDTSAAGSTGFAAISLNTGYSAGMLRSLLIDEGADTLGTNWFNFDLRSIQRQLDVSDFSDTSIGLFFRGLADPTPVEIVGAGDISSAQGLVQIGDDDVDAIKSKSGKVFLVINFDASDDSPPPGRVSGELESQPIVADFFSFGKRGSAEVNNAIYRFELEETLNDSGVFIGTIEHIVTNQMNLNDPNLISSLRTIDSDIRFLVGGNLLDEDGIVISYPDLDKAGKPDRRDVQTEIRTHSGRVTVDSPNYRFGQAVVVTLDDPDLNTNSETIQTFGVINDPGSPHVDTVGANGKPLLEIKLKGIRYQRCTIDGITQGGLGDTGFVLAETSPDSGVFRGSFKMPSKICNNDGTRLISPAGGGVDAKYYDFRDASGNESSSSLTRAQRSVPVAPTVGSETFDLPKYKNTLNVMLSGSLEQHSRGSPVSILIRGPDASLKTFGIIPTDSGKYMTPIPLRHDSPTGVYRIEVIYQGELEGVVSFTLSEPEIPAWIRDAAGWWDDGIVSDVDFFSGIEYLVMKGLIEVPASRESPDMALPYWVRDAAGWWNDGLISDEEFISALQFLVKKGIIRI